MYILSKHSEAPFWGMKDRTINEKEFHNLCKNYVLLNEIDGIVWFTHYKGQQHATMEAPRACDDSHIPK